MNIMAEWYARDTSKKIRAVMKNKGEAGEYLCTIPPYGFIKDPDDKKRWVVDEEAADVVRRIFNLCLEGNGPSQIARMLETDKVLVPSAHWQSKGISCQGLARKLEFRRTQMLGDGGDCCDFRFIRR